MFLEIPHFILKRKALERLREFAPVFPLNSIFEKVEQGRRQSEACESMFNALKKGDTSPMD